MPPSASWVLPSAGRWRRGVIPICSPSAPVSCSRKTPSPGTSAWRRCSGLGGALVLLVAGLDRLWGWSPAFSGPLKLLALALILAGYALGSYALIANRFFSGTVRIQTERGHHVVSSGPYRWLRHPGYAGALVAYLATPFFLDSAWAFLPTLFVMAVLVVRTALEDRTLQAELAGYREYAGQVRYRLLPGVW